MINKLLVLVFLLSVVVACGTTTVRNGTLAELGEVKADLQDVYLDDSLERAAQSYRRYLEETSGSARTPEAMRRLADLQIEQAYGIMGNGKVRQMTEPEVASRSVTAARDPSRGPVELSESDREFEQRATQREDFLTPGTSSEP